MFDCAPIESGDRRPRFPHEGFPCGSIGDPVEEIGLNDPTDARVGGLGTAGDLFGREIGLRTDIKNQTAWAIGGSGDKEEV